MDLSGKTLGNHRLIRRLGAGATATVYLAEHATLGRRAALKILHPHLLPDPSSLERFQREARVLSRLDHANIVRLYDFTAGPDAVFLVCEYVEGDTLSALLKRGPFPPELAAPLVIDVCEGLAEAHRLGIVHRDIKPENILITPEGLIKVSDFGIARILESEKLTLTGALMGSPHYMPPEQIECGPVTPASDIHSLGVLLYRLVTGALPFESGSQAAVLKRVLDGAYTPASARSPRANPLVSAIIDKSLRRDPGKRYPDARALGAALLGISALFGLKSAPEELPLFLGDPDGYDHRLRDTLPPALLDSARKARKEGNEAKSLAALTHVLALVPDHADARRLLNEMRGRRGRHRAYLGLLVFLALTLALLFLPTGLQDPIPAPPPLDSAAFRVPPPDLPAPAITPRQRPLAAPTPIPARTPAGPVPGPDSGTVSDTAPSLLPPPASGPGRLRFSSDPWAKVIVDGEYRGKTPFAAELLLSPGRHHLMLVNPWCDTLRDSVWIAADSTSVRRYRLIRKPGGAR